MAEAQDVQQETEDDSASIIFHLPTNENMFRVIENMNLRIPAVIPYINSLDACWISDLNEDDRTCYICNEDFAADQLTEQAEGQESPIRLTWYVFSESSLPHFQRQLSRKTCFGFKRLFFPWLPHL